MRIARYLVAAGATGLICAPAAFAQAQYGGGYGYGHSPQPVNSHCEQIRDDKRLVGGLIGAVAGGALGVAIADDDDDGHYHRKYRGHRGYYGHRGWRHGRRHGGYYHHDSDGDEIAGALIGGVLGAVVGSELAGSSVDCTPKWNYAEVPPPTRQAFGGAWNAPPRTSNYGNPPRSVLYSNQPLPGELAGGPTPIVPAIETPYRVTATEPTEFQPECTTVQRETSLPDGNIVREPVEVCRSVEGSWFMPDETGF
ncbi:MAG: hypothetical protein AAGJ84_03075 [Pseudomonadota bacterium]